MKVKIDKNPRTGMYILRSQEMGRMATAKARPILMKIAIRQRWAVVRSWS